MPYHLAQADLEALLQGGCFFGSGGGGTVTSARHLAAHFVAGDYYPCASVRVVDVAEATEGEAVMVAYLVAGPDGMPAGRARTAPASAPYMAQAQPMPMADMPAPAAPQPVASQPREYSTMR